MTGIGFIRALKVVFLRMLPLLSLCIVLESAAQTENQSLSAGASDRQRARVEQELQETISLWAGAWAAQLTEPYIGYYTSTYYPPNFDSRDEWVEDRRERIESPESIQIRLLDFELLEAGPLLAIVRFTLMYSRPGYSDRTDKELELIWVGGSWRISREKNISVEELGD
jgi:hypothetical protein